MSFRLGLFALLLVCACASSSGPDVEPSLHVPACARLSACFEFNGLGGAGLGGAFDTCLRALPAQPFGLGGALGGLAGLRGPSESAPEFECVLMAEDCEAAGRCINGGEPAINCETSRCDGDILRGCAGGITVAYDCESDGDTCIESEGLAQCGQPASCPERTSECRDGRPVFCNNDVETSFRCDLDCIEFRESAVCADTRGAACEPGVASSRCDGDVAIHCPYGFETSTVCPSGTCEVTSDGALCQVPRDCSFSTCDGDVLRACHYGHSEAIDCGEVGARTCQAGELGPRCIL